jgi:hypothetical protein
VSTGSGRPPSAYAGYPQALIGKPRLCTIPKSPLLPAGKAVGGSDRADNLRPDCDHSNEKSQRRQRCSFMNNRPEHHIPPS